MLTIHGYKVVDTQLANATSVFVDEEKNMLYGTVDTIRKLIWIANKDDFDTALKAVTSYVLFILYRNIDRAFNYRIEDVVCLDM